MMVLIILTEDQELIKFVATMDQIKYLEDLVTTILKVENPTM